MASPAGAGGTRVRSGRRGSGSPRLTGECRGRGVARRARRRAGIVRCRHRGRPDLKCWQTCLMKWHACSVCVERRRRRGDGDGVRPGSGWLSELSVTDCVRARARVRGISNSSRVATDGGAAQYAPRTVCTCYASQWSAIAGLHLLTYV